MLDAHEETRLDCKKQPFAPFWFVSRPVICANQTLQKRAKEGGGGSTAVAEPPGDEKAVNMIPVTVTKTVAEKVTEAVTEDNIIPATVTESVADKVTEAITEESETKTGPEGIGSSAEQGISTETEALNGDGEAQMDSEEGVEEKEPNVEMSREDLLGKRMSLEAEQAATRAARMANLSSELKRCGWGWGASGGLSLSAYHRKGHK